MMRLVVDLAVSEDLYEQVARYFRALVGPTSSAPGCLRCNVSQGLAEPKPFLFRAEWATREDLEEYIKSNVFRSLLHILELAYRTPRVEFETISEVKGMEYAAQVQGAGARRREFPHRTYGQLNPSDSETRPASEGEI